MLVRLWEGGGNLTAQEGKYQEKEGTGTWQTLSLIHISRSKLNGILSACTGQPIERIEQDTERDNYMTAEEAKAYGLIDEVITQR